MRHVGCGLFIAYIPSADRFLLGATFGRLKLRTTRLRSLINTEMFGYGITEFEDIRTALFRVTYHI